LLVNIIPSICICENLSNINDIEILKAVVRYEINEVSAFNKEEKNIQNQVTHIAVKIFENDPTDEFINIFNRIFPTVVKQSEISCAQYPCKMHKTNIIVNPLILRIKKLNIENIDTAIVSAHVEYFGSDCYSRKKYKLNLYDKGWLVAGFEESGRICY